MVVAKQSSHGSPLSYLSAVKKLLGRDVYWLILISGFIALLEGIAVLSLIPMLSDGESFAFDYFGISTPGVDYELLVFLALIFVWAKSLLVILGQSYNSFIRGNFLRKMKMHFAQNYFNRSLSHADSSSVGKSSSVINKIVDEALGCFYSLVEFFSGLISLCIYICFLLVIDFKIFIQFVIIAFLCYFLYKTINKILYNLSLIKTEATNSIASLTYQGLVSHRYLFLSATSAFLLKQIKSKVGTLAQVEVKSGVFESLISATKEPMAFSLLVFVFFEFHSSSELQVTLILVGASFALLYRSVTSALICQASWQMVLVKAGGLEFILQEYESTLADKRTSRTGAYMFEHVVSGYELREVGFSYDGNEIFKGLSFSLPEHGLVCIRGPSGCGKSTLLSLMMGGLEPSSGCIYLNDVALSEFNLQEFRKRIGVVVQNPFIFSGSVRANIALSDDDRSDAVIWQCLEDVGLLKFVSELEFKLDSKLGEGGIQVSGGQAQRICLAREVFKRPQILFLDEASSALDDESESLIYRCLSKLKDHMLIVDVSHRNTVAQRADIVVEIGN